MTVTDEAVDLTIAAMPDRYVRFGRWEPALARAEVYSGPEHRRRRRGDYCSPQH